MTTESQALARIMLSLPDHPTHIEILRALVEAEVSGFNRGLIAAAAIVGRAPHSWEIEEPDAPEVIFDELFEAGHNGPGDFA